MKAAPLLRAWLQRLRHPAAPGVPVQFHMRHRWLGWQDGSDPSSPLRFDTPARRTGSAGARHRAGAGRCQLGPPGLRRRLAALAATSRCGPAPAGPGQLRIRCCRFAGTRTGRGLDTAAGRALGRPAVQVGKAALHRRGWRGVRPPGRIRAHCHRHRRQPGVRCLPPAARPHRGRRPGRHRDRPAAAPHGRVGAGAGAPPRGAPAACPATSRAAWASTA